MTMLRKIFTATAFITLASSLAMAGTVSFTHTTPLTSGTFTDTFTLPNFPASMGTLTGVTVNVAFTTTGAIDVLGTTSTDRPFTNATSTVPITLTGPASLMASTSRICGSLNATITCTGLAGTGVTASQVTGITFEIFGSVDNPPSSLSLTNNDKANSHSGFAYTDSEFTVTGLPAGVTLPLRWVRKRTFGVLAGTCTPLASNCVTLAPGASTTIGVGATNNTGVLAGSRRQPE